MRLAPTLISAAIAALGLMTAFSVRADEYADVSRMLRGGQFGEAMSKADQFLAGKPKDPQMRFLKGVIFTEQNKPQDAINTFNKLIEDYPELPEPYNNLAVLQAGQGQFDKARAALEMAIRTNPSYATAHENLGDVYAKLASQAYSKALQLDGANTGLNPKLSLIRDLFSNTSKPRAASTAPAPVSAPQVAAAPIAPRPAPASSTGAVATAPAAATPAPTAVAPAPTPAAPAAKSDGAEADIRNAVQNWASAWSRRDLNGYFSAYGKDFEAAGGRANWEAERKQRILGKNKISVKLSNMDVKVTGNTAKARFKQDYDADSLSVSSRKVLDLTKVGDKWLIVREVAGS